jgi:hypothetical protein
MKDRARHDDLIEGSETVTKNMGCVPWHWTCDRTTGGWTEREIAV